MSINVTILLDNYRNFVQKGIRQIEYPLKL